MSRTHNTPLAPSFALGAGPALEAWKGVRAPVSLVIPTRDDEGILRECLATCGWCDDVHVVDFGSLDNTRETAAECGATVHTLPREDLPDPDLPPERIERAMRELAGGAGLRHGWVLHVQANERLTPDLVRAIAAKLASPTPEGAIGVPCKFVFMERWLKRAAGYPAYEPRLFRADAELPGARPVYTPENTVDEPYIHFEFIKGLADWLERCNQLSASQAARIHAGVHRAGDPALRTRSPTWTFLRTWLFGLGCLDGGPGLTYCILRAYFEYQVGLKVREMQLGLAPPPPAPAFPREEAPTRTPGTPVVVERTPVRARPAAADLPTQPWERFGAKVRPGQRVIVTGGSGFIGTNLVEFYDRAGAEVINIDFQAPRNPAHQRFWRNVNICNLDAYNRVVRDFEPELFLHLAARTDLDEKRDIKGYAANTVGVENTLRVLEGLRSLKRIIITSSQLVCRPGYVPKNYEDYAPHTLYGQSKVQTELITRAWKDAPCPWTLIRPTSIWGPWFHIPYKTFFLAVAERKYMHQRGVNPIRSFGFVYNGVFEYAAMTLAPEADVDRQTFYLSNAEPIKVREWADMIQAEMGVKPLREIPLSYLVAAAKIGDVCQGLGWKDPPLTSFRLKNLTGDNTCDMTPVTRIIGDMPYSVEEGVRITVDWMRREGSLPRSRRRAVAALPAPPQPAPAEAHADREDRGARVHAIETGAPGAGT